MKLLGPHLSGSASTPRTDAFCKWSALLLLGSCLSAWAGVYHFEFNGAANNPIGTIPDGQVSGWSDSRNPSSPLPDTAITDVSVALHIDGGFNGDLYGYLSHNGVLVPLLNRVGVSSSKPFGYSDSGLNITLSDAGLLGDIHRYQQVAGYKSSITDGSSWTPDGRLLDPLKPAAAFDTASRVGLNIFNNMDPNGTWTLFLADLSGGGGSSQVVSWELNITAVPEPVNVALGVFLGVGAVASICRSPRLRSFLRNRNRLG